MSESAKPRPSRPSPLRVGPVSPDHSRSHMQQRVRDSGWQPNSGQTVVKLLSNCCQTVVKRTVRGAAAARRRQRRLGRRGGLTLRPGTFSHGQKLVEQWPKDQKVGKQWSNGGACVGSRVGSPPQDRAPSRRPAHRRIPAAPSPPARRAAAQARPPEGSPWPGGPRGGSLNGGYGGPSILPSLPWGGRQAWRARVRRGSLGARAAGQAGRRRRPPGHRRPGDCGPESTARGQARA